MTTGAVLGVVCSMVWAMAWTRAMFYLAWAGIGLAMALVLYEPAFAAITQRFRRNRERALTAVTLVAGFASTIFVPLATWLLQQVEWRPATAILATLLAATTIPLHALGLGARPSNTTNAEDLGTALTSIVPRARRDASLRDALRSARFWLLAVTFVLGSFSATGLVVHLIPFLLDHGWSAASAALALGTLGGMQVPGRMIFGAAGRGVTAGVRTTGVYFVLALTIVVLALSRQPVSIWTAVVVFGMANGMATLVRASAIADVFGTTSYGSISGVLTAATTLARAAGPFGVAVLHEQSGNYGPAFLVLAVAMVFAGLAAARALAGPLSNATDARSSDQPALLRRGTP